MKYFYCLILSIVLLSSCKKSEEGPENVDVKIVVRSSPGTFGIWSITAKSYLKTGTVTYLDEPGKHTNFEKIVSVKNKTVLTIAASGPSTTANILIELFIKDKKVAEENWTTSYLPRGATINHYVDVHN